MSNRCFDIALHHTPHKGNLRFHLNHIQQLHSKNENDQIDMREELPVLL